jgi:hypothetical protein
VLAPDCYAAAQRRRSLSARFAILISLTLVTACTTPGATTPIETDDTGLPETTFTVEPEPTDEPIDTSIPTERPTNDIGDGRPSTVTVTIAGNTSGANGTHTATGLTRVCGNLQFNAGNPNGFNYEFPFEGEHNPKDVSFAADDLLPGASTSTFHVDIGITTDQITPSIIVDPGGTDGDAGTATRTEAGGTTTLVVHATNFRGETIDLTATCGPRSN